MKDLSIIENKDLYLKNELFSLKENEIEIYYLLDENNLFHHETMPSLIMINKARDFKRECYFIHGILYRKEGPAEILYCPLEMPEEKDLDQMMIMSFNEKYPKENKAPLQGINDISFYSYFALEPELMFSIHRFSYHGPSYIEKNSLRTIHKYETNGKFHREDGPAFIEWNEKGEVLMSLWYLEGCCI